MNLFEDLEQLLSNTLVPVRNGSTFEENPQMLRLYRDTGDPKIAEKLVKANQRLVWSIAKRYLGYQGHDLSLDDLISAGNIGLLTALRRFDTNLNTSLSTYATHWIRQSIVREICNTGHRVRLPVHVLEKISMVNRIEEDDTESTSGAVHLRRTNSLSEAEFLKWRKIRDRFLPRWASLQDSVGEDKDMVFEDNLEARHLFMTPEMHRYVDPTRALFRQDITHRINMALSHLRPVQREVVEKRFGLNGCKEQTLEQIGLAMSVTRERIRQIEFKALERLRAIRTEYFSENDIGME